MILRKGALAALLVLAACRAEPAPETTNGSGESRLEIVPLVVASDGKRNQFRAEVARTDEEQARGLMYRDQLAPDAAMIFPFVPPRPASFWMKDTLIPLDMLFVRPDGTIAFIKVNAVPQLTEPIGVEEPLAGVVEVAGGRSAELGIEEGDKVSWPGGPAI